MWWNDVVVTFDGDGLYWHPDHIAVHERTIGAVRALGDLAPALYFVSMPQGRMRRALEAAQAASEGDPEGSARQVLDVDVDAFGAEAPPAALALEVGAFAARKLQALRRHRSQLAGDPLDRLPEEDASRVLGLELYRRADVGSQAETFLDRLGSPAETIWVDGEDLEG